MELLSFEIKNKNEIDLERINRLRKKMQDREASICSERALIYTKSFLETENKPYIIRKAIAFAKTLDEMSIYIENDSLIFGNQASKNFAAPIFPEYSIDWVIEELDEFDKRTGDRFLIEEKVKDDLRSIHDYWSGNTHQDEVKRTSPEILDLAVNQRVLHRGGISMSGDGHIVPNHEYILKKGFRGIISDVIEYQSTAENEEELYFYKSVLITLEAALRFVKRYGLLAKNLAKNETNIKRKEELFAISEMSKTLLERPAQNFYEGVQIVYLVHVLHMIESNGHSFCYGRFDQYMYDLYKKDIEDGVITQEKALEIITHMFLMNSSNNKLRPYSHTRKSQGYPL